MIRKLITLLSILFVFSLASAASCAVYIYPQDSETGNTIVLDTFTYQHPEFGTISLEYGVDFVDSPIELVLEPGEYPYVAQKTGYATKEASFIVYCTESNPSQTIYIMMQPTNQPPVLSITSPQNGAVLFGDSVNIQGTATDPDDNLDHVTVKINDQEYGVEVKPNGNWFASLQLSPGIWTAEIWAVDSEGLESEHQSITFELRESVGDGNGATDGTTPEDSVYIRKVRLADDELSPGDQAELEVKIKNTLDYEIEDAYLLIEVEEFDDGDTLEIETADFDIDEHDTIEKVIKFDVPYDIEQGRYDIKVTLYWEDQKGNEYFDIAETDLKIERNRHELALINLELSSQNVQAGEQMTIGVKLANIGENDETASISVICDELDIAETLDGFELREGDTDTQYLTFTIPEDAEGKYLFELTIAYGEKRITKQFVLDVSKESFQSPAPAIQIKPVVSTKTPTIEPSQNQESDTISYAIFGLLLLAVILLIAKMYLPEVRK